LAGVDDAALLARRIADVMDLSQARYGDEFFYQSLSLCALDAVFSIGVRWQAVRNVVARYCGHAGLQIFRPVGSAAPPLAEQESVSQFCARLAGWGSPDQIAAMLGSRQRTSTSGNSILKAEATLRFAEQLRDQGIEYLQDMASLSPVVESLVLSRIRGIPGQGSGISWAAFRMLSGDEDQVKPDRMVSRFIRATLGREVTPESAVELVRGAALVLRGVYPQLTPRLLDAQIWKYQSSLPRAASS
jgi:hypothetical protein